MVIGKLKWFGGFNKQIGKVNNHGYIEVEKSDDILIERNNIPVEIQGLLESQEGKGIYLEFEIDESGYRPRAINVRLLKLIGVIKFFKYGWGYIEVEGRGDVRINSSQVFHTENILYFGLRYNTKYHNDQAENPILINESSSIDILEKCVNSGNFNISHPFILNYIDQHQLSDEDAVNLILDKIEKITDKNNLKLKNFISNVFQTLPCLFKNSPQLREYLDIKNYSRLLNELLKTEEDNRQVLISEILEKLRNSSEYEKHLIWLEILFLQNILEYKNDLWELAPITHKRRVIQNKFQYFLSLVADFQNSNYPYAQYISRDWQSLYTLNKSENDLIFKWDKTVRSNAHNAAKMISARGAEKLVMEFYRNMGYQVEDISIHQVTDEASEDWKVGDIRVGDQVLIDVKNARKDFNSSVYSEFCIPHFKKEREQDVNIAGVFSPYVKKTDIDSNQQDNSHRWFNNWRNPQFIGICNKSIIKSLEEHFSDTVIQVNIQRKNNPNEYLPPWLFDYGYSFYVEQRKITETFCLLQEAEMPTWDDLNILEINKTEVLHLFLAAKKAVPQGWSSHLPSWKVNFINDLVNVRYPSLTLPYLFLSILKHFISMFSYQENDFSPEEYKHLCSLKSIYDPLNLIGDFCTSLSYIWQYRDKANLHEFKIFKFNGKGLLTGQRARGESLIKLLAYCGGQIEEKKVKCGKTPLVIGKNATCEYCKCLICDKCDFCKDECPRKGEKTQRKIQTVTRSPLSFSSFDNSLFDEIPF